MAIGGTGAVIETCPRQYLGERGAPSALPLCCLAHCPLANGETGDVPSDWLTAKRAATTYGLPMSTITKAAGQGSIFANPYHVERLRRGDGERYEIAPYPRCGIMAFVASRTEWHERKAEIAKAKTERAERRKQRETAKVAKVARAKAWKERTERRVTLEGRRLFRQALPGLGRLINTRGTVLEARRNHPDWPVAHLGLLAGVSRQRAWAILKEARE